MVIADLNIICINQTFETIYSDVSVLSVETQKRDVNSPPIYHSYNFSTADKQKGVCYTFWPEGELFFTEPFFDLKVVGNNNMILLNPVWKETLHNLICFYISRSPSNRICFFVRIQDKANNIVHEVWHKDIFWDELDTGKICFNEIYFVTG